jgi:hypothetical protein
MVIEFLLGALHVVSRRAFSRFLSACFAQMSSLHRAISDDHVLLVSAWVLDLHNVS